MTKAKTPVKRAPGRPRKDAAEKPEQFSVRLPPKLKFGLELLARAQHRSLSQVVEWAVQMGMNTYEVGRDFESLTDLLTAAWEHPEEGRRLLEIYRSAPALLSFEEAAVCELVDRALDPGDLEEQLRDEYRKDREASSLDLEDYQARMRKDMAGIYWRVIWHHWDDLRAIAVDRTNSGKSLQYQTLAKLLKLDLSRNNDRLLAVYRSAAESIAAD
jgi:hypothetical protein